MDLDRRKVFLLLHRLDNQRSTCATAQSTHMILLWSRFFYIPPIGLLFTPQKCAGASQQNHVARPEGKNGASCLFAPELAANLSLTHIDNLTAFGPSHRKPRLFRTTPTTSTTSSVPNLVGGTMLAGVDGTCPFSHGSQPASKPHDEVDNHLIAFHVTQPPTGSISQSNSLVVITSSEHLPRLDRTHSQLVNLRLATVIDSTTFKAHLNCTATCDKQTSRSFDVPDAAPTSSFCSSHAMFLGRPPAVSSQSSAPSLLQLLNTRRLNDKTKTPYALHCFKLWCVSLSLPRFVFEITLWMSQAVAFVTPRPTTPRSYRLPLYLITSLVLGQSI